MEHPEEEQWLRRAQSGDRQAFALLVDRYWRRIYRWTYGLAQDAHAAEDLTQEVFLRAWGALDTLRASGGLRSWLYRIAANLFVDYVRRRRSLPLEFNEMALDNRTSTRDHAGPVAAVLGKESQALVEEALRRLPDDFRAPLLLRVQERLSFQEIGRVLALTEETARWRVFKARQLLLEDLGPHLNESLPS